jgi:UDP-N-acetylmuramoyl-L-alanyl-D-glutamate--2,6-diaminopimelate ligase
MMQLGDLLVGVPGVRLQGDAAAPIREVRDDSRLVGPGDLFVAVAGTHEDGNRFIDDAVSRGAAGVVAEGEPTSASLTWARVPSARRALGVIAANRFAAARDLTLAAVTGTSGKTTLTYLVESILAAAGRMTGVVGTVSYRYPGRVIPAPLTTPGALALHAFFAELRAAGGSDVVLEASSHALDQGRLHGCRFRAAGLTNVTQDHLDYHATRDEYFAAKALLFAELLEPGRGTAVLFADREDGQRMRASVQGALLTVATRPDAAADVTVTRRQLDASGIKATLATPVGPVELESSLVGGYNLENIVLATGMGVALGVPADAVARGVSALRGVPGRLERVPNEADVLCLVDYSHKPDALDQALQVLRPLTRARLILVFGCGGDRDRTKRPIMGEVAARGADLVVVTSDNPRTEDPGDIIAMIVPGIERGGAAARSLAALGQQECGYLVEPDRRAAIRAAVALARPGDTVMIAGKGHEDYQIVGAIKVHFDDREEAAAAFAARPPGGRS